MTPPVHCEGCHAEGAGESAGGVCPDHVGCPLCALHAVHPWPLGAGNAFFDYEAQPKESPDGCDLCGGWPWFIEAKVDRYGLPVQTVRCGHCGLVFQQPHLAPAGLRALYSGPYRALVSAWHGREINAQTLEPEQAEYGRKLASVLAPLAGRVWTTGPSQPWGRILDLGGSTGVVGQRVGACLNYEHLTVVEPSVAEARAAGRLADRVYVQSAEDFDPGGERYDLILLCQTVDHLRSISAVLRKVKGMLAPGGRFFVDAVDAERIPEGERYKVDHIYSLTRATMRAYLERAGFVAREVPAPSERHVAFLCEVA